jgi:hypothetical protein
LTDVQKLEIYNLVNNGLTAKEVIEGHFPTISRQTISSICKKFREEEELEDEDDEEEEDEDEEEEEEEVEEDASIASVEKDFGYLPIVKNEKKQKVPEIRQPELQPELPPRFETRKEPIFQEQYSEKQQEFKINPVRFSNLSKIHSYIEKFQHKLYEITGTNLVLFKESLKGYSDVEIAALLETIKTKISSNGINSGIHHIFHVGATVVENLGPILGLNLKNYADNLARNNSVRETIDEISIEHLSFMYVSPERRLAFLLLMNLVATHNMNETESSMTSVLEEKVDVSIIEKYKDL